MSDTPIPTGNDVRVNTVTLGPQLKAAVAALAGGGFVVTWESAGPDGSGLGIFGQRYASDGTAVGGEFGVNSFTAGPQISSSTTGLADGGFVVTWMSSGQDFHSGNSIHGQRYAPDGTAVGGEFRVNSFVVGNQTEASTTALADGGFVVTWSCPQDGSGEGIYGQRYASDGSTVGSEFRVNTETLLSQFFSSTRALADGGFVVTWTSFLQDGSGHGIYGQRYASDGTTVGGEFRANTHTPSDQTWASTTGLADGGFVVTWTSFGQDGGGSSIYGQRYASDGTTVGGEFKVNSGPGSDRRYSSTTDLPDGGFVVTWSSFGQDGSGYGIYGQRYAADGTALGNEFRINQTTNGDQFAETPHGSEAVTTLADGRLVQVWSGTGEVFFRLVNVPLPAPTGLDLAAEDDTGNDADNVTSTATGLTISGSAQDGATVTLFDDVDDDGIQDGGEATLGSVTATGGAFSFDIALDEGSTMSAPSRPSPATRATAPPSTSPSTPWPTPPRTSTSRPTMTPA